MRWSIIRLIWVRELRDQLRDRRTVFMIAVLPIILYPVAGIGVMQLAMGFIQQRSYLGLVGAENLPSPKASPSFPVLFQTDGERLVIAARYLEQSAQVGPLVVRPLDGRAVEPFDRTELAARRVDVVLVVPPDFTRLLERGEQPKLYLLRRERDEHSKMVARRVEGILGRWKHDLAQARLASRGLPPAFLEPFAVRNPDEGGPGQPREAGLFLVMVRVFPFILVMWSLAGALYPAVDLCAGEKERGTMETLLISPASREEIVYGKFLTIWVFSAATALLNLLSMGLTTWQLGSLAPSSGFRLSALLWGVALLLPLSAFFSAVCLSIGAYARSSKEGQYYLMPLFLLTMPLIFLTLAPGVDLNPFYSMVPVTGVALLLQKLMTAGPADRGLYLYFVPVLAPMVIYSWLALRWAVGQFQREEVLFREAERLDLGLWLRGLLRDKEALPTAGEAFFCFGLVLALRWLSFNVGTHLPLLARTGTSQLAFVAAPPLFMAVVLTTRPAQGLGLRKPPLWSVGVAVLLAVLVSLPLAELTLTILRQFPAFRALLEEYHPLTRELGALAGADTLDVTTRLLYLLGLGVLPALCEELAFRGFVLQGLRRAFRPWTAILLSSFLFSLYQMNVFQLVPHFLLGIVLGLLAWKSGSVVPAMVFHLVYNVLFLLPSVLWPEAFPEGPPTGFVVGRVLLAATGAVLALGTIALVARARTN